MAKKILWLLTIATLFVNCGTNIEQQNLDIYVTGRVINQNNYGIPGINVYVQRGKWGNYVGPSYENYEILTTNASGNYNYTVKNDTYVYRICCGVPPGYTLIGEGCKDVNHSIFEGHTLPNNINFKLNQ